MQEICNQLATSLQLFSDKEVMTYNEHIRKMKNGNTKNDWLKLINGLSKQRYFLVNIIEKFESLS